MLKQMYLALFLSLVLCPVIFAQEKVLHLKKGEVKVLRASDFPIVVDRLIMEDFSTFFIHKEMAGKKATIKANYFEAGFRTHIVFTLQDSFISRLDILNNTQPELFQQKADKGADGITHRQPGYGQTGKTGGNGGKGSNGRPIVQLEFDLAVKKIEDLKIELWAEHGGNGGNAGHGALGGGSKCSSRTHGGNGGNGGKGGDGGLPSRFPKIIFKWRPYQRASIQTDINGAIPGVFFDFLTAHTGGIGIGGNGGRPGSGRKCFGGNMRSGNWGSPGQPGKFPQVPRIPEPEFRRIFEEDAK